MRYLFGILCVLLLLFTAVQYNDPDGPLWMAIYGIPALTAGYAAWRPDGIRHGFGFRLVLVLFLFSIAAMIYYWPTTPGFWHEEVWWKTETAREGMGVMILTVSLAILAIYALVRRN
jgi:Transmembrane family 220, helix